MNNRSFIILLGLLIIIPTSYVALHKSKSSLPPRMGTAQAEEPKARDHVPAAKAVKYTQTIPTSGPHANEASWGYYAEELPNSAVIHNMEHGGVIASYRPNTDPATVKKLKGLFTKPYANAKFSPTKAIVMPRAQQTKAIMLTSWDRSLELDTYQQQTLINYYLTNVGHSPEPRGL